MEKNSSRGTPDQKIASMAKVWRQRDQVAEADKQIASTAKVWRQHDQVAIADKHDGDKQRAEYAARKDLRKVIDEAGVHS